MAAGSGVPGRWINRTIGVAFILGGALAGGGRLLGSFFFLLQRGSGCKAPGWIDPCAVLLLQAALARGARRVLGADVEGDVDDLGLHADGTGHEPDAAVDAGELGPFRPLPDPGGGHILTVTTAAPVDAATAAERGDSKSAPPTAETIAAVRSFEQSSTTVISGVTPTEVRSTALICSSRVPM